MKLNVRHSFCGSFHVTPTLFFTTGDPKLGFPMGTGYSVPAEREIETVIDLLVTNSAPKIFARRAMM